MDWIARATLLHWAVLAACGSSTPAALSPPADQAPVAVAAPPDAGSAPDAGPVATESEARALLTAQFRSADLRVRHDVGVSLGGTTLVLDGWDPARRIGFEYVAASEGDPLVPPEWRAALARAGTDVRVLVIDERAPPAVELAGSAFLVAVTPRSESDP